MSKIFNNTDIYIQGGNNGLSDEAGIYWNDPNQSALFIDSNDTLNITNNTTMVLSAQASVNIGLSSVTYNPNTTNVNISATNEIGFVAPNVSFTGGAVYINGSTYYSDYTSYPSYSSASQYAYYNYNGNSGGIINPPNPNANVSLLTAYRIACGGEIDCVSDVRIKHNILDILSTDALDKIRLLQPKTFYYIDKNKGNKINYGFIAQEVEKVFHDAITTKKDYIPNILEHAKVIGKNKLTFPQFLTKHIVCDNLSDIKIKVYLPSNKEFIVTIQEVMDDSTIVINEEIDDEYVFVYGQEVNDFHLLEKNAIFTLTTSAVKQLDKELQETKQIMHNQQDEINALKEEMRQLKDLFLQR